MLVGAFALLLTAALWIPGTLYPAWVRILFEKAHRLENLTIDGRFAIRGKLPAHPDIVVLGITTPRIAPTDFSEEEFSSSPPLQWMAERSHPWNRATWAALTDQLLLAGARRVVFDMIFAEPNPGDDAFRQVIEKHPGKVVLGFTVQSVLDGVAGEQRSVFGPNETLAPTGGSAHLGYVVYRSDTADDPTIRRVDYFTSMLREMLDTPDDTPEWKSLPAAAVGEAPLRFRQPINFQGPPGTYPALPVQNVFSRKAYALSPFRDGSLFRDKIVFVGAVYELAHDEKQTPFGTMPGVEVHAQVTGDLLEGKPLRELGNHAEAGVAMLLAALVVGGLVVYSTGWGQAIALVTVVFGYAFFVQQMFEGPRLLYPVVVPLGCALITGGVGITFHLVLEQAEGALVRSVLERQVSKNVAAVVLRNAEQFENALHGERRSVTVLFSDVRGFTAWSESVSAEDLVAQLNEYFFEMVGYAIIPQDGTLQKYIGDAILAVWGDTHSRGAADDAIRAVSGALKMRECLAALNTRWQEVPGRRQLAHGIGLHHDAVIVGEVGHPDFKREYTVLGDGVNLAARLESATKQFHVDILVSAAVEELTRNRFLYRIVDKIVVKGKTRPIEVFTPLGTIEQGAPSWMENYREAVALFRRREFLDASRIFEQVRTEMTDDYLCEMYSRRCAAFMQTPPANDWTGEYVLTDK
jgi:adenylate cyclase